MTCEQSVKTEMGLHVRTTSVVYGIVCHVWWFKQRTLQMLLKNICIVSRPGRWNRVSGARGVWRAMQPCLQTSPRQYHGCEVRLITWHQSCGFDCWDLYIIIRRPCINKGLGCVEELEDTCMQIDSVPWQHLTWCVYVVWARCAQL
jgi:hypothetical protein